MEDDLVTQFTTITAATSSVATQYLRLGGGDLEQAIQLFFANDGADLEPAGANHTPPVPASSTRPPGHEHPYTDGQGIVHLDSDEDNDPSYTGDNDDEVHETRAQAPASRRTDSIQRGVSEIRPPVEEDEALARRLQEEDYGGLQDGGGSNALRDQDGYRAPIARTTQTLVGPGSFDPSNEEEMRAAVMEQMMARRAPRAPRGKLFPLLDICFRTDSSRTARYFQSGQCWISLGQFKPKSQRAPTTTCSSYGWRLRILIQSEYPSRDVPAALRNNISSVLGRST